MTTEFQLDRSVAVNNGTGVTHEDLEAKTRTAAVALTKAEKEEALRAFVTENFKQRGEEGDHGPSKAYGKINFKGSTHSYFKPRYLRLSDETDPDHVLQLITDHWDVPEPKLIVSIVGGANRFDNGQFSKNRIQTLFKQGLPEIATTTGAWIITPGSKSGVYQMVGSAMKDYMDSTGSAEMRNIVVMGISSWGAVSERERLDSEDARGQFPAHYPTANIFGKRRTHQPIDPNHSHFLLVDDGSRDVFGGEEKWRAKFESKLVQRSLKTHSTTHRPGEDLQIPFVVLLVNGGDGSLQTCAEKLDEKVPLLAIAGSGRAAEVCIGIKKFVSRYKTQPTKDNFLRIYVEAMGYAPSDNDVYDSMETIATKSKYISVFDFCQPGINTDDIGLDRALLAAIYHKDEMNVQKRKAEMRLAIAWKNVEYARLEIFNITNADYTKFMEDREFFSELALQVLLDDMPELMVLFVDHGLDLAEFVTEERLCYLYEKALMRGDASSRFLKSLYDNAQANVQRCSCCPGYHGKVSSESSTDLIVIGELIKDLLGYSFPNVYKRNQFEKRLDMSKTGNSKSYASFTPDEKYTMACMDPAQHIFLWATLFNRMDYARMFWRSSRDHIAGAIVGAAIMRGLAKRSNHQEGVDITIQYSESSLKFEALANGILECCWQKDRQYTSDMLVRESPGWGHTTVLSMAHHAEMEEFLAQPACYTKLTKLWRGDIALRTHPGWIILFAFCPLFVFALKFVRKHDSDMRMDEHTLDPAILSDLQGDDRKGRSQFEYRQIISVSILGRGRFELSIWSAVYKAMRSPIVKCIHYALLFLAFLVTYSLFMMSELRPWAHLKNGSASPNTNITTCETCCLGIPSIGCLEIITYCFVFSYLLEEIRQILFRDTRSLKFIREKFHDWITDFWNQLDVLSHVLFVAGVVLRFYVDERYFEVVRWMFSITLCIYFVRFSQIFFIAEQLGPKVIMIRKMVMDLVFFVVILLLVMVFFGVVTQSIVNPNEELSWNYFNSIIYKPYFQMYGELFLEDYEKGHQVILLGFYMIITNVLMLNLLIAMFSYTFDKVQEKAEILWKYNYYGVVYEHYDRPYFPFVGTIINIIRAMRCSERCAKRDDSNDFRRNLDSDKNDKITKFVKLCMEKYMANESKQLKEDMAYKVNDTARRGDKSHSDVRAIEKRMMSLDQKLDRLMEMFSQKT